MNDSELERLKERLLKLDLELKVMLEHTQAEVTLAREIQKKLVPTQLPDVQGIEIITRYIAATQATTGTETYDIFLTRNNRFLWTVMSFTGSFGLSSVLLSALNQIHARNLDGDASMIEQVFRELAGHYHMAKKPTPYRLLVGCLDLHHLRYYGISMGMPPPLFRSLEKNFYEDWALYTEGPLRNPELWKANRTDQLLPAVLPKFELQLPPGTRFYLTGNAWAQASSPSDFLASLRLKEPNLEKMKSSLIEDVNEILIQEQTHLKQNNRHCDLIVLALEISAKKIHLA